MRKPQSRPNNALNRHAASTIIELATGAYCRHPRNRAGRRNRRACSCSWCIEQGMGGESGASKPSGTGTEGADGTQKRSNRTGRGTKSFGAPNGVLALQIVIHGVLLPQRLLVAVRSDTSSSQGQQQTMRAAEPQDASRRQANNSSQQAKRRTRGLHQAVKRDSLVFIDFLAANDRILVNAIRVRAICNQEMNMTSQ